MKINSFNFESYNYLDYLCSALAFQCAFYLTYRSSTAV